MQVVPENFTSYLLLIIGALFVHACYQLSVSVFSYMSSHKLGRRVSARKLFGLGVSYSFGAIVASTFLILGIVLKLSLLEGVRIAEQTLVSVATAVLPVIGVVTIFGYYRRGPGTKLWLPRAIAEYLVRRAKKTRSSVEAFLLGVGTVIGEIPFLIAPILIISVVIFSQPVEKWLVWSLTYGILSATPLLFMTFYLTSGRNIVKLQRWREDNKDFLRWTSGMTLILLTVYLMSLQIGVRI